MKAKAKEGRGYWFWTFLCKRHWPFPSLSFHFSKRVVTGFPHETTWEPIFRYRFPDPAWDLLNQTSWRWIQECTFFTGFLLDSRTSRWVQFPCGDLQALLAACFGLEMGTGAPGFSLPLVSMGLGGHDTAASPPLLNSPCFTNSLKLHHLLYQAHTPCWGSKVMCKWPLRARSSLQAQHPGVYLADDGWPFPASRFNYSSSVAFCPGR